MLWLLFAVVSAISGGAKSLVHRFVLRTEHPLAYAFFENLFTGLLFVPLLVAEWVLPVGFAAWGLLLAGGIIWTFITVIAAYSYKFTEVSLRDPISQSRMIWLFVISALLLGEVVTGARIAGTLLIFVSMIILVHKHGLRFGRLSDRGVQLTLLVAFLAAFVTIVDKVAMSYWNPGVYGTFVYLIPAVLIGLFVRKELPSARRLVVRRGWYVILAVVLGLVAYYSSLRALALADAMVVFPILRLSTIIAVVGGITILHERKEVLLRLVAAAFALAGVYLLV